MEKIEYSEKEIRILLMNMIIITCDDFTPGVDCGGEKPFGTSLRCKKICTGDDGLKSVYPDLKLPCGFQVLKNQDFKKKLQEGIAGI